MAPRGEGNLKTEPKASASRRDSENYHDLHINNFFSTRSFALSTYFFPYVPNYRDLAPRAPPPYTDYLWPQLEVSNSSGEGQSPPCPRSSPPFPGLSREDFHRPQATEGSQTIAPPPPRESEREPGPSPQATRKTRLSAKRRRRSEKILNRLLM